MRASARSSARCSGAKAPTFDEALDYARRKIGIYVDVKQASAKDTVEHIAGHGMADHVEIQDLNPNLEITSESATCRQPGARWTNSI